MTTKRALILPTIALCIVFSLGFVELRAETAAYAQDENQLRIAQGERDNALALAEQYKAQYQAAVFEISDLKAENENLTAALDELRGVNKPAWTSAGEFRIYHYCPCVYCTGKRPADPGYAVTATGARATEGRTVAVDPDIIPFGSEVLINGQIYIAEDTGVAGKCIDLFINDHAKAVAMGTYLTTVSWRET